MASFFSSSKSDKSFQRFCFFVALYFFGFGLKHFFSAVVEGLGVARGIASPLAANPDITYKTRKRKL